MKLFAKEKGIILCILNAILVLWFIAATVITVSNATQYFIKDYEYTYEEYKKVYCDFEYETKEECDNYYETYKLDRKIYSVEYKRNIIVSISNVILVTTTLFIINKEKKK